MLHSRLIRLFSMIVVFGALAACAGLPVVVQQEQPASAGPLLVYSGRNENLVGPLIERFQAETGITVQVRYGDTAEMAATILEEGQNSPADIFFAQDAGALGALASQGRLSVLPDALLGKVDSRLRSPDGQWVGASGRVRVVVYNTERLTEEQLPDSIWGFVEPEWQGRIGWAPANGSFQAMVTALRQLEGEERARQWLAGMVANDAKVYANNTSIVEAVGKSEIDAGLVNHYYLYRFLAEQGQTFPARNYYLQAGDAGALINIAGLGILDTSKHRAQAERFVEFLLSPEAQQYFADETVEYPVIAGVSVNPLLKPLAEIKAPAIDLSNLEDLQGTLELLQDVGAL